MDTPFATSADESLSRLRVEALLAKTFFPNNRESTPEEISAMKQKKRGVQRVAAKANTMPRVFNDVQTIQRFRQRFL